MVNGVNVSDTQYETSGTVSRVARSDFPTDTDLPDAFYFVPATTSDIPWRYEANRPRGRVNVNVNKCWRTCTYRQGGTPPADK